MSDNVEVVHRLDAFHRAIGAHLRHLFAAIVDADAAEVWKDSEARDLAHWLCMRYDLSEWKARRWIAAAHALQRLPAIAEALVSGEIGVDKVVELTRFATPETEGRLVRWAQNVSGAAIRRRADLAARQEIEEVREAERWRSLAWWYHDEGRRFRLEADLPAASGAVVAKALDRLAQELPSGAEREAGAGQGARLADALVGLCSARIAADADPDRATVIVHASVEAVSAGEGGCQIEGGPVIHPEIVRRLLCDARVQTVVEDDTGRALAMGRVSREPSAALIRQLRYRDHGCRFDSCGARRFLRAHHIQWWGRGGPTELDNLILICSFHHSLVHEHGWAVRREQDGSVAWFRPDRTRYRSGPAPPKELADRSMLVGAGA